MSSKSSSKSSTRSARSARSRSRSARSARSRSRSRSARSTRSSKSNSKSDIRMLPKDLKREVWSFIGMKSLGMTPSAKIIKEHKIGINVFTLEEKPVNKFISKNNTNIIINYRTTNYVYSLRNLFALILSMFENDDDEETSYSILCNDVGDTTPYLDFTKYGIPYLTMSLIDFFKVVFNIENLTFEDIQYLHENKEKKQKFFTKLAKGHKYYQITETGIQVELDNNHDNDCQNNRPISLGIIKPIELHELY